MAEEKTVFPTTNIEFLGIGLNTIDMEFSLPADKVYKLCQVLLKFIRMKKVSLKEMQSLLGQLAFAARVLPMGRVFSRRLYSSISGLKNPSSHVRVNSEMKADLLVWLNFL